MDIPDGLIITIDDVRKAGLCAGFKTRRWFEDQGIGYQDFIRNGVEADRLLATGDGHAELVVARRLQRGG